MRTLIHYTLAYQPTSSQGPTTAPRATFSPPVTIQRSPWHSPVVYSFGALAAVLGMIAFALLLLACSYFHVNGEEDDDGNTDVEGGATEKRKSGSATKAKAAFENKFFVIMAGEVRPTFLATPISITGATSFNPHQNVCTSKEKLEEENIKRKFQTQES